ncbi:phosphocarrier protein HPr [Cohnella kolymensis]|uniref:Phosphocarrier protein HPr n=1 Tax=Cohnella kolymensis TaxID=1590652 RepID=A0ABR5A3W9_9BACL|nr:HPr family phosphocarrier protein [Cohnella kolymensis]KIL35112.1 phosphocarrier protein HPr [Cohnella kolymensis]KIL36521.1 phosphocarrier protein HPr [Cohnella kolymensis]
MITKSFTIINPTGFHVRPTKTFVQTASQFPCKVNVINKGKKVNGKSSLSMLTLGIATGDEVTLEIDGEQEAEAMEALGKLLVEVHE